MRRASLQGSLAIGLCLALCAACSLPGLRQPEPEPKSAEFALVANCRAVQASRDWKRSDPPPPSLRMLFTVPRGAPAGLWFRDRDGAVALCTACAAGSSAVQSFEWYARGFTAGELKLKPCGKAKRP
jgi:hypothetical protein